MENNEIYIDGVNVAGCEYYYRCDCKIDDDTDINLCKWHDDCYYKQLKQAENTVNECHKYLAELEDKIESLEQENKALQAYKDINEDFKQAWYELNEKYKQLRSALEEIREIANEPCIEDEDCETCDSNCMCKEILTKINEVLNLS